jgi:hypothetical protein
MKVSKEERNQHCKVADGPFFWGVKAIRKLIFDSRDQTTLLAGIYFCGSTMQIERDALTR